MSYKTLPLSVLLLATLSHVQAFMTADKIVCFYESNGFSIYEDGSSFKPENIDPNLCTHVLYRFLSVNTNGKLKFFDLKQRYDECYICQDLIQIAQLKQTNPDLKVLLSVGSKISGPDWAPNHDLLAYTIHSVVLRTNFIDSAIENFKRYDFDGLDIDWRYPQLADKGNFSSLLREIKTAFSARGYLLSVTTSPFLLDSYDVDAISESADLINLMTYEFSTVYDGVTGHSAPWPLVIGAVKEWTTAGANETKLTIALPFHGLAYTLVHSNYHDLGAPATVGLRGKYSLVYGYIGYDEICAHYGNWTRVWDKNAQAPYMYNGTNWISYEDEESVAAKAKRVDNTNLGGIAVWTINTDDFTGRCGTDYPLLRTINKIFFNK